MRGPRGRSNGPWLPARVPRFLDSRGGHSAPYDVSSILHAPRGARVARPGWGRFRLDWPATTSGRRCVSRRARAEVSWTAAGVRRYVFVPPTGRVYPGRRLAAADVSRSSSVVALPFRRVLRRTPDGRLWALCAPASRQAARRAPLLALARGTAEDELNEPAALRRRACHRPRYLRRPPRSALLPDARKANASAATPSSIERRPGAGAGSLVRPPEPTAPSVSSSLRQLSARAIARSCPAPTSAPRLPLTPPAQPRRAHQAIRAPDRASSGQVWDGNVGCKCPDVPTPHPRPPVARPAALVADSTPRSPAAAAEPHRRNALIVTPTRNVLVASQSRTRKQTCCAPTLAPPTRSRSSSPSKAGCARLARERRTSSAEAEAIAHRTADQLPR